MSGDKAHVLVLGGGPDAEREVSLESSRCVAAAIEQAGFPVTRAEIDRLSIDQLRLLPGDVIFPALHGGWGEGGPLQDLLESCGRPFVGSGSSAARHAMDKIATKMTARAFGITTSDTRAMDLRDPVCPLPYPVVVKPVHEGSTIGLHICHSDEQWAEAREGIEVERRMGDERIYMIEPYIRGRELTVGVLDGRPLPVIEIIPAAGLYDYEAKYTRNDTSYVVNPDLPGNIESQISEQSARLAEAMRTRHIARVDFILDQIGEVWLLEINTMPGFTTHSLVPMAARAMGMEMPDLCETLVRIALNDGPASCWKDATPGRALATASSPT